MKEFFLIKGRDLNNKSPTLIPLGIGERSSRIQGAIDHPYPFELLKQLKTADLTHGAAINKIKTLSTGFGFEILNYSKLSKKVKQFIDYPSTVANISLYDLLQEAMLNFAIYGNINFDIVKVGDKAAMYSLPPQNIYVFPVKKNNSYIIGSVDYYGFVDKDRIIAEYKPAVPNMVSGKHYIYTIHGERWLSNYYGSPAYDSAIPVILINKLIQDYDLAFFDNNAMPDLLITITGGMFDEGSKNKIKEEIESNLKGVDNAHKTAILSTRSSNAKVEVIPIQPQQIDKFTEKYYTYENFINSAHGFPGNLFSMSKSDGNKNLLGNLKAELTTTIIPLQTKYKLHIKRIFQLLFNEEVDISFNIPDLTSDKDMAIIHNLYANMGAMGRLEIRRSAAKRGIGIIEPNDIPNDLLGDNDLKATTDGRAMGSNSTDSHDYNATDISV